MSQKDWQLVVKEPSALAPSGPFKRKFGSVGDVVVRVLTEADRDLRLCEVHARVEQILGSPVANSSVKNQLKRDRPAKPAVRTGRVRTLSAGLRWMSLMLRDAKTRAWVPQTCFLLACLFKLTVGKCRAIRAPKGVPMRRLMIASAALALVALAVASAALATGGLSGKYEKGKFDIAFTTSAYADYFEVHHGFYTAVATGGISVTGKTITFKVGATGPGTGTGGVACAGIPGTYTFSRIGTTLQFKLVSDACAARKTNLAGTWKVTSQINTTNVNK